MPPVTLTRINRDRIPTIPAALTALARAIERWAMGQLEQQLTNRQGETNGGTSSSTN